MKPKPAKKKEPFRVFEAGAGIIPTALVKQAARSAKQGRKREFTGIDLHLGPKWLSLLLAGKFKMPAGLELKRGDAIKALQATKGKSQNIVFASYLLNNIDRKMANKFFRAARRVLKPGGRIVLIQDMSDVFWVRHDARKLGWRTAVFKVPDSKLKSSPARALRERSSPSKRKKLLTHYRKRDPAKTERAIVQALEMGSIGSVEEYVAPVAILMQKPREKPKKKQ